jgi:hypothetical protein
VATYYVRLDSTSDANLGTTPDTTGAVRNVDTAINKASAGDTIKIAPGTYRKLNSITVSGASGNPINIIGDWSGSAFASSNVPIKPDYVILSAFTTNDTTAPPGTSGTLAIGTRSWLSFSNLVIFGSTSTGGGSCVQAGTLHSRGITFTDCSFHTPGGSGSYTAIWYTNYGNLVSDWLIDRCTIYAPGGTGIRIDGADPASSGADIDINFIIRNSVIEAPISYGVRCIVAGTSSAGFKPGGVKVRGCVIVSSLGGVATTGSADNWSHTFPTDVQGCLLIGSIGVVAQTSGQITEDYNAIPCNTPRTSVTTGAHSKSGNAIAPMWHIGQERIMGRAYRPHLSPMLGAPWLNSWPVSASPAPSTYDLLNRPRPAGGLGPDCAMGAFERHDTALAGGAANADGAVDDCWMQTGPADDDFEITVDPVPTTITIKQMTSSYVGTNYPMVSLLANPEIGVSAQDVSDTSAHTSYTTLTIGPFTPSGYGAVILRLRNLTGDGAGIVFWDTGNIT